MTASLSPNYWIEDRCAKAFWGQHELAPFRRLVRDTLDWAAPSSGEKWLDLGCGGGALSKALWQAAAGPLGKVVGVDCSPRNVEAYDRLQQKLSPDHPERIGFICHDFSSGLALFETASFDHAISGLSISYAESLDPTTGKPTTAAYERLLKEVNRVLKPGGRFVFSVNVPEPSWGRVGFGSVFGVFRSSKPLRYLKNAWRMMQYGAWLKREARTGRFHYLPQEAVTQKLQNAGFVKIDCRLSYSRQAYIFRAVKPSSEVGHAR